MATYYDEHADLEIVQGRRCAVLGEDQAALVHAGALRDAGVDVRIGASADAPARELAEAFGIAAVAIADAVAAADLVVLVDTGPRACERFAAEAVAGLTPEAGVLVVDPLVLRYDLLTVPADHDVVVVHPLAPPAAVERELQSGRGVPVLVAVHRDVSGSAQALALSYALAIGGTRAGAIGTTVAAAAETALFGEYAVAGALIDGLVSAGFDTLVEAGFPKDLAYLACVHSLRGAVDRAASGGEHDDDGSLAEFARRAGGVRLADEHLRDVLHRALAEVRDGSLAGEYVEDLEAGGSGLGYLRSMAAKHPVVATGRRVRRLLPWIATSTADARHAR